MARKVDILVLSDVHLGTYGCQAAALLTYLKSVQPRILVLNGDIIDIWQFKKNYFPPEHLEVLQYIFRLALDGVKVYYLTGNHDDLLRKFGEMSFGAIHLRDKLVLQVDGKKHWIFHGDVFDTSIQQARWLARLGGAGYNLLIRFNRLINTARRAIGLEPSSFASRIKKRVKGAVKYMHDYENTALQLAAEQGYDCVICGHIHLPQMRTFTAQNGHSVLYLNSGDWVEHATALEYAEGQWTLYTHPQTAPELPPAESNMRPVFGPNTVVPAATDMPVVVET